MRRYDSTRIRIGSAISVGILAAALSGCGSEVQAAGSNDVNLSANSNMTYDQATTFSDYKLWSLGTAYGELPLTQITSVDTPTEFPKLDTSEWTPPPQIYVDFEYGTCNAEPQESGGDSGCYVPLEIQSWRSCSRNLSFYSINQKSGETSRPYTLRTIRGVPVAVFGDGSSMVEVYTGSETVVVFGDTERALQAIESLQVMNANGEEVVGPGDPMPAPVDGALDGALTGKCDKVQ
jgi:hypothetical protein